MVQIVAFYTTKKYRNSAVYNKTKKSQASNIFFNEMKLWLRQQKIYNLYANFNPFLCGTISGIDSFFLEH